METSTTSPTPIPTLKVQSKRRRSLRRELIEMIIIVFVIYFGFRAIVLPYQVEGASMTPYLVNGERVFVSRMAYARVDTNSLWNLLPWEDRADGDGPFLFDPPKRGDIIVLHPPEESTEPYVKRVIGLPGEVVTFDRGSVLIDGVPLTEEYIDPDITWCAGDDWCEVTVPEDSVYVLGDNRQHSTDSRVFGPIAYDRIIGKAVFASWPFDEFGPIERPNYAP